MNNPSLTLLDALYPSIDTGLLAGVFSAQALGAIPYPVCCSIVSASPVLVTDVTEVPADTVHAQLQQLEATTQPEGIRVGVLGSHQTVDRATSMLASFEGPTVLDVVVEGEAGSTILTPRGVALLKERLHVADLVVFSKTDAELFSEGEIHSLDDAQVAAQRLSRRGARRVLIKCGTLPGRFFEESGDGHAGAYMADLYYDGSEFGVFEAPHVEAKGVRGASSALSVAILIGLMKERPITEAIQDAKRYVTEALRHATHGRLGYDWPRHTSS